MSDQVLRDHVLALLRGGSAYMTFDDAVANFPEAFINARPPNALYTFWHLLEHVRIAQWDILEYARNPKHVSPEWPVGYWPAPETQADAAAWQESVRRFKADRQAMEALVADPNTDLFTPIPHGYDGHTILREALLVADHNAYHIGELAAFRQIAGAWPKDRQ
ncbi:MAG TPA: DinB family protein [Phototrophicaceae bacterium]|nr:DinB family protein [Phototrophicaceae bacterium]